MYFAVWVRLCFFFIWCEKIRHWCLVWQLLCHQKEQPWIGCFLQCLYKGCKGWWQGMCSHCHSNSLVCVLFPALFGYRQGEVCNLDEYIAIIIFSQPPSWLEISVSLSLGASGRAEQGRRVCGGAVTSAAMYSSFCLVPGKCQGDMQTMQVIGWASLVQSILMLGKWVKAAVRETLVKNKPDRIWSPWWPPRVPSPYWRKNWILLFQIAPLYFAWAQENEILTFSMWMIDVLQISIFPSEKMDQCQEQVLFTDCWFYNLLKAYVYPVHFYQKLHLILK